MSQSAKKARTQVAPRRGWARPLGADATALTDAALRRAGFPDPSLVLRWPEIAGPETAKLAQPIRCRMGPEGMVLTLRCEPGAGVFLQHETRTLIARLNAFLGAGAISRIRIVSGPLTAAKKPPAHPFPSFPARADPRAGKPLLNALNRLADLRKELLRREPSLKSQPD
jgi:hypothetical protein